MYRNRIEKNSFFFKIPAVLFQKRGNSVEKED